MKKTLSFSALILFLLISCQAPQNQKSVVDEYYNNYVENNSKIEHLKVSAILKEINSNISINNYVTHGELESYLINYSLALLEGSFISENYTLPAKEKTINFTFSFVDSTKDYYIIHAQVDIKNFPPQLLIVSKELINKINNYEFQNPE